MKFFRSALALAILAVSAIVHTQISPVITLVANAEGENPIIAPNTWLEVNGLNLAKAGDSPIWQASDFVNTRLPAKLDGVNVTMNCKSAYVYYIGSAGEYPDSADAMRGLLSLK